MADVSLTVVGAGAVGLSVAARLARRFKDLVILERHAKHGQETSSRNSEVIHAGMYYPTGSLKARLCLRGNALMYDHCARYGVAHRRITKIIVATETSELPALEKLLALGTANGVTLTRLSTREVRDMEPHVRTVGALLSPNTGIVSAHELMDSLLRMAQERGATLQAHTTLVGLERRTSDYHLTVKTGDLVESFTTERVVNAAGLEADRVAELAGIDVNAAGYRLHHCKGSYFAAVPARAGVVARLVYPLPARDSLGTHAVLGLDGRLRFGPDVQYLQDRLPDYTVDESRRAAFGEAVRRLLPCVSDDDLVPDMAGIRAKLQGPGDPFRDFVIAEESARGLPGLVNLVGIDSPGLTSAPAIAAEVDALLPS